MTNTIQVVIPGKPVPKGRHRTSPAKLGWNGKTPYVIQGHAFTPANTRNWEKYAAQCAQAAMVGHKVLEGPIQITLIAMLPIADSWPHWKRQAALEGIIRPTSTPDLDNLEKAAKDALNKIVWLDDGQVVSSAKEKRYNETPGVVVTIEPLPFCASQISTRKEFDEFLINHRSN